MGTWIVALEKDVYDQWCSIRTTMDFASDTQIAKVLMQQFGNTQSRVLFANQCVHCHRPLSLFCTWCNLSSQPQPVFQPCSNADPTRAAEKTDGKTNMRQTSLVGTSDNNTLAQVTSTECEATELPEGDGDSQRFPVQSLTMQLSGEGKPAIAGHQLNSSYPQSQSLRSDVKEEHSNTTDHNYMGTERREDIVSCEESSLSVCFGIACQPELAAVRETHSADALMCSMFNPPNPQQDSQVAFTCSRCALAVTTQGDLDMHMKMHHESSELPMSEELQEGFQAEPLSKTHMHTQINKKLSVCTKCGASFTSVFLYRKHMKSHGVTRPFACGKCGAAFLTNKKYKAHACKSLKRKTSDDSMIKDNIEITITEMQKSKSQGKPKIEFPVQEHRCDECERVFTRKTGLKKHIMRAHTTQEDKPYVCTMCGHGFTTNSELVRHTRRHTGEKIYVCDTCAASFVEQGGLNRHRKIHEVDRKMFICEVCGSSFTDNHNLNNHMRIHSGERPYKCSECEATFRLSSILRKHERKHKGDRKFVCSECGRAFTEREYWRSHMRTHTGERPFVCDICGAGFAQKGSLNSHRKTHNNVTLTDGIQV